MSTGKSGTHRIIMLAPDGTIAINIPTAAVAADSAQWEANLTRLQTQGFVILKTDATGADLPNERAGQSRRFRNQWRWDGTKIEADLPLAREQVMAEVRAERNARLDAADKERGRLEDVGNQSQRNAHATYRQSLRALPETAQAEVDALTTAADLEAYAVTWPSEPA